MMNTQQARVIDPILTTHALGYKHPARVGHVLFPQVPVQQRGGTILEFGKESFRLINARRAPGADTGIIAFGYEGKPYQLVQDALNSTIPTEHMQDARQVPNIDLGMRAVNQVMQQLTLLLETEQAELATNPDNYSDNNKETLSGTSKWTSPSSDPLGDIDQAKEVVRQSAGVDPNRMVISKTIFNALKVHPKITERFKYTSSESITVDMLANYFDLDQIGVGKALALSEDGGVDSSFKDVWQDTAVLAYVPSESLGFEEPSFGYTYTLQGHPFVEKPFYDHGRKSWVYGVTYERKPVLSGIDAGFLFQNAV